MKFKETGSAVDFDPAPQGMHIARCIRIIDLGTAMDTMYQKEKHDVFFMWEIPGEMKSYEKDGQQVTEPFTIGKYYTMSLSEGAHLRTDLESWRSVGFTPAELAGFDPKKVCGAPCMINVVHKPKKKKPTEVSAVITAVTPLVKGLECPPAVHPLVYFSMDDGEFDQVIFDNLSSGLKARVIQSSEYRALTMGQPVQQHPDYVDPQQNYQQQPPQQRQQPIDDGFDDIPF